MSRSTRTAWSAFLVMAVVSLVGGALLGLRHEYWAPGPARRAVRVNVVPGLTVRGVLNELGRVGVLAHPRLVELYVRLTRRHLDVKAGEYKIPARSSAAAVIALLASGRVLLDSVTVVPGSRFSDFRKTLETDPNVRSTLKGKTDAQVMAAIGHPGQNPEGRFFPDTYKFAAGTTDVRILKMAYGKMRRVLAAAWAGRSAHLPYKTAYQALILASIIEKETALPAERPLIAGVFVLRLRKGMRLQSDPTVIYGLGAQYNGDITSRDLTTNTAYNTYTHTGLPPTPISLPSRASILAAVHPKVTGALYFVASGDADGAHVFSKTLRQHDVAVRHYLARLRAKGLMPSERAPARGEK